MRAQELEQPSMLKVQTRSTCSLSNCANGSTASLVVFPRLVKYPTSLSIISFQDASLASPKLSVALFKDHCLEHYDLFFMYVSVSNLHFPQMKLASEKPPEAVLKNFQNFPGGSITPHPPTVFHSLHAIPHPLWKFGQMGVFLLPTTLLCG